MALPKTTAVAIRMINVDNEAERTRGEGQLTKALNAGNVKNVSYLFSGVGGQGYATHMYLCAIIEYQAEQT